MAEEIPAGYAPLVLKSEFAQGLGPFYERRNDGGGRSIAIRVERRHCNSMGVAHGGFLLALADLALSYGTHEPGDVPPRITLSLTSDFAGVAREGDWLEAHVDVQKNGRTLIFANAYLCVNERRIVRASGVFKPDGPR